MKVLVLGATGFIGNPIALAYVRAGHDVYGVTRSKERATKLQVEEITPVIASTQAEWTPLVETIDVIVDAGIALGPEFCYQNFEAAAKGSQSRPKHLKLTYIFVSGTWSYGDSQEWRDERGGQFTGKGIAAWRTPVEETVITHTEFNGSVVRPGIVYGRNGGLTGLMFDKAAKAALNNETSWIWPARPGGRWGTVHQDDVAELVLRVGEAAPITKHVIFDALNTSSESVGDILTAVSGFAGGGIKHEYSTDKIEGIYSGFDTNALSKPSLGRAMLDWVPKKKSFVDGMPIWWASWKASQEA